MSSLYQQVKFQTASIKCLTAREVKNTDTHLSRATHTAEIHRD